MPAVNYSIDEPSLGRVKKGFILKFRCNFENSSDSKEQIIPLRPTRKFLEFKDHVAHQIGPSHGLHFNKLLKQCEGIVYSTIRSNAQIFNTIIDDRSMVHLLIDLDSAFADSMLEELLQKDVHIPLFYENKESALYSKRESKGRSSVVKVEPPSR